MGQRGTHLGWLRRPESAQGVPRDSNTFAALISCANGSDPGAELEGAEFRRACLAEGLADVESVRVGHKTDFGLSYGP